MATDTGDTHKTLTTPPVAALLHRLFAEDDTADPRTSSAVADPSADERARLMSSKTDTSPCTAG